MKQHFHDYSGAFPTMKLDNLTINKKNDARNDHAFDLGKACSLYTAQRTNSLLNTNLSFF